MDGCKLVVGNGVLEATLIGDCEGIVVSSIPVGVALGFTNLNKFDGDVDLKHDGISVISARPGDGVGVVLNVAFPFSAD